MDLNRIKGDTAAWVEVWLHGAAHPTSVLAAFDRLTRHAASDPRAVAVVEQGRRVLANTPFGSVQAFAA